MKTLTLAFVDDCADDAITCLAGLIDPTSMKNIGEINQPIGGAQMEYAVLTLKPSMVDLIDSALLVVEKMPDPQDDYRLDGLSYKTKTEQFACMAFNDDFKPSIRLDDALSITISNAWIQFKFFDCGSNDVWECDIRISDYQLSKTRV